MSCFPSKKVDFNGLCLSQGCCSINLLHPSCFIHTFSSPSSFLYFSILIPAHIPQPAKMVLAPLPPQNLPWSRSHGAFWLHPRCISHLSCFGPEVFSSFCFYGLRHSYEFPFCILVIVTCPYSVGELNYNVALDPRSTCIISEF